MHMPPSQTLPLITHAQPHDIVAWRAGKPVTAARFLADVARLAALLPAGVHMLNACSDRYRFAVGLGAALTSARICLLPSTHTPEVIRQLADFAPDASCLTDQADCSVALPQVMFPPDMAGAHAECPFAVPQIDCAQLVAYVFTSGSTGVPLAHRKTWGALVHCVQAEAALCGLDDGRRHAVVGTVPPQHMYGFESTVLMPLLSANALVAGQAFYPADICQALAAVPRPRALVSTPVHLRAVIGIVADVPAIDLVVCATAPLSQALAVEIEARLDAPLLEIYGSTETGQIAMRHSARTAEWTLFRGLRLWQREERTWASGGHVEQDTPMNDLIELLADDRFLLHGRMADMINIAGKRNSLANLNLQLNAIEGVQDGVFFMPEQAAGDSVTRLTALVVAPGLSAVALLAALKERIDPAFLPRPLLLVERLPRNATGKLPQQALEALAAQHRHTRAASGGQ